MGMVHQTKKCGFEKKKHRKRCHVHLTRCASLLSLVSGLVSQCGVDGPRRRTTRNLRILTESNEDPVGWSSPSCLYPGSERVCYLSPDTCAVGCRCALCLGCLQQFGHFHPNVAPAQSDICNSSATSYLQEGPSNCRWSSLFPCDLMTRTSKMFREFVALQLNCLSESPNSLITIFCC